MDGDLAITSDGLPKSYSAEETTATLGGVDFDIVNVANFGNGIQMKGNVNSYIKTHAAFEKEIKSITLTVKDGKTWYPENVELKVGSTVVAPTSDETSSTYDLSSLGAKEFTITNTSTYAVYIGKMEIKF